MEKNFLKKIVIVLIAGLGIMTYSCSEEDLFEEELNVRSLSKRNMSSRMEDNNQDEPTKFETEKITSGTHSEKVIGKYCNFNVSASWTGGYTSDIHNNDQISRVTASATSENDKVSNIRVRFVYWTGNFNIDGEILYDYYTLEPVIDLNNEIIGYNRVDHKNISQSFYLNPSVTIIPSTNGNN